MALTCILYVLYVYTLCHACIYTVHMCVQTYIVQWHLLLHECVLYEGLLCLWKEGRVVVYTLSCWVWWLRAWDDVTFIGNGTVSR